MAYVIGFASGARQAFEQLDIEVQENVLDAVDRLAEAADALPARHLPQDGLHDLRFDAKGRVTYVFLTLMYDVAKKRLIVRRLGFYVRTDPM